MSGKWLARLLLLPFMLFLIYLYGWAPGGGRVAQDRFLYENF